LVALNRKKIRSVIKGLGSSVKNGIETVPRDRGTGFFRKFPGIRRETTDYSDFTDFLMKTEVYENQILAF
jgi:hypothetical protein